MKARPFSVSNCLKSAWWGNSQLPWP